MNATRKPMHARVRQALTLMAGLAAVAVPQVFAQGVGIGVVPAAQASTLPAVALPAAAAMPSAPTRSVAGESARVTQAARAARLYTQPGQGGTVERPPCAAGGHGMPASTPGSSLCN